MVKNKPVEDDLATKELPELDDEIVEEMVALDSDRSKGTGRVEVPIPEPEPVFVQMAVVPRFGTMTVKGPITGNFYHVNKFGNGDPVDMRDALGLAQEEIKTWCWKTNGWIKMKFISIIK